MGNCCKFLFLAFHLQNVMFVLEKLVKLPDFWLNLVKSGLTTALSDLPLGKTGICSEFILGQSWASES